MIVIKGRYEIMTQIDFALLEEDKQIALLQREGVYIGKRKAGGQIILLYQLESFYVEIFYRKHRCFIDRLTFHSSTSCLEPYLSQIQLMPLVFNLGI